MSRRASPENIRLAGEVLAKCAAYEPRMPVDNDATLLAWAEQIMLINCKRDLALDAVAEMFSTYGADPNFRPTPGVFVSVCREMRRDRAAREQGTDLSIENTAPPITLAEWERRHNTKFPRSKVGKDLRDLDPKVNPLNVTCPYCRASNGYPCTVADSSQVLTKTRAHPSRFRALWCQDHQSKGHTVTHDALTDKWNCDCGEQYGTH